MDDREYDKNDRIGHEFIHGLLEVASFEDKTIEPNLEL